MTIALFSLGMALAGVVIQACSLAVQLRVLPTPLRDVGSRGRLAPAWRAMTSQGTAHGRFTRAIKTRNLWAAELALREIGNPSLLDALDYLDLLAETRPEKLEAAAIRWHGRLEIEARAMTIVESQLALAALASLCAGERGAVEILRRLLRRVGPTLARPVS